MNTKEKLLLVKLAASMTLDDLEPEEQLKAMLADGKITPEEAQEIKDSLPSAVGTGVGSGLLMGGLGFGINSAVNKFQYPAFSGMVGAGVGLGSGLLSGGSQAMENSRMRDMLDEHLAD